MSVDALVHATVSLNLEFRCCDECCKPTFFFLADDPDKEIISRNSKRKFYVVKKGSVGSEGIYTDCGRCSCHLGAALPSFPHAPLSPTRVHGCPAAVPAHCSFAASTDYTVTIEAPPTINAHMLSNFTHAITRTSTNAFRADNSRKALSRVREPACPDQSAEAELLSAQGSTLLVGNSLQEVEDDDNDEVIQAGGGRFYRVFGSPRVGTSREAAVAELVAKNAPGLFVGHSLAVVDDL
ncbi:hypothetical protein B0H14DRAFT_2620963 [Mycena olivaceomarginata]|nr:hypothetical protein B0H14DRAFT_2620963 [Mycena olivaceomarginata]